MHAGLDSPHDLELPLKQRQRRAHRRLGTHVADLHVRDGPQPPTFLGDLVEQCQQHLTRLLVWERHDVVLDGPARDIHVSELPGRDGRVITLDAHTACFQPAGQVAQRTCVNQLPNKRSASAGVAPDDVNKTHAIRAEARDVVILHQVLTLLMSLVFFFPVTVDGQHLVSALVYRDDVR